MKKYKQINKNSRRINDKKIRESNKNNSNICYRCQLAAGKVNEGKGEASILPLDTVVTEMKVSDDTIHKAQ